MNGKHLCIECLKENMENTTRGDAFDLCWVHWLKAKKREYHQRPEVKAKMREYHQKRAAEKKAAFNHARGR